MRGGLLVVLALKPSQTSPAFNTVFNKTSNKLEFEKEGGDLLSKCLILPIENSYGLYFQRLAELILSGLVTSYKLNAGPGKGASKQNL